MSSKDWSAKCKESRQKTFLLEAGLICMHTYWNTFDMLFGDLTPDPQPMHGEKAKKKLL